MGWMLMQRDIMEIKNALIRSNTATISNDDHAPMRLNNNACLLVYRINVRVGFSRIVVVAVSFVLLQNHTSGNKRNIIGSVNVSC